MELGEPHRITSDVRISFRGEGAARFRLQHARDEDGRPCEVTWCDVGDLAARSDIPPVPHGSFRSVLVDEVRGDLDVTYHRYKADWLRVVPLDDDEAERCKAYSVEIVPLA